MKTPSDLEGLELPPRPEEPLPGECCGRGCERCVYVYYEEALQRWEKKIALIKAEYRPVIDGPDHGNHEDNV